MTLRWFAALALLVVCLTTAALPSAAQEVEIPADAVIDSATLFLYAARASNETVYIHPITADWGETDVTWNSFGGSYGPASGSFASNSFGWHSVDVTALVQGWVDGSVPNYGVLLEEPTDEHSVFYSSEYGFIVALRPKLEICYTSGAGSACATIQRGALGEVADAYIWEPSPDSNFGTSDTLFTGLTAGNEKQSLIRFFFDIKEVPDGEGCTPGFWRQEHHYDSWVTYVPADDFNVVFGVSSSFAPSDLGSVVWLGKGGENALGRHAVAALLNAASPGVDYAYTEGEVIAMVQAAYASGDFEGVKDQFEVQNELGCSLD